VRHLASDRHSHRFHLALTNIARQHKETSEEMLRRLERWNGSVLGGLEAIEQSHSHRYTEMHRDLACVYWEMARLRADIANLQVCAARAERVRWPAVGSAIFFAYLAHLCAVVGSLPPPDARRPRDSFPRLSPSRSRTGQEL
jgi:hypothetical protein